MPFIVAPPIHPRISLLAVPAAASASKAAPPRTALCLRRRRAESRAARFLGARTWTPARCDASRPTEPNSLNVAFDSSCQLLWAAETEFNQIQVWETADGSRLLFLDPSMNLQSWYNPAATLTRGYYDLFALAPALMEEGRPLAVLGMGAGTAARLLRALYPGLEVDGWELDGALEMLADMFFGLDADLASGAVRYHVGDATDAAAVRAAAPPGGFGGLLVDLFAGGALLGALEEEATWRALRGALAEGGVLVANLGCGGEPACRRALDAISAAFGPPLVCTPPGTTNCIALSWGPGPAPSPAALRAALAARAKGLAPVEADALSLNWNPPS